jgi:hypothetical protein
MRDKWKNPINQRLDNVLTGKYVGLTGEANLSELLSLAIRGKDLQYVQARDDFMSKAETIDKLGSVISPSMPLTPLLNAAVIAANNGDPTATVVLDAQSTPQIIPYIFGADILGDAHKLKNEDQLISIFNDPKVDAFTTNENLLFQDIIPVPADKIDTLFTGISAKPMVPVGKIQYMRKDVNGQPVLSPVYLTRNPDNDERRVLIMTSHGLERKLREYQKDIDFQDDILKVFQEGGYIAYTGPEGGTLYQNLFTGLFLSFDRQGVAFSPDAYTFDQFLTGMFLLDSKDPEPVHKMLAFYQGVLAQQMSINHGQIEGLADSYDAFEPRVMGWKDDIASTAAIGILMMQYEQQTHNTDFHGMLKPIADYLVENENKLTASEPAAIAYQFLQLYSPVNEKDESERKLPDWWYIFRTHYDKEAGNIFTRYQQAFHSNPKDIDNFGLMAHGIDRRSYITGQSKGRNLTEQVDQVEKGFAADATLRWIEILTPQHYIEMGTNVKLTPDAYVKMLLQTIPNKFKVPGMFLLDNADLWFAQDRPIDPLTGQPLRVGSPEVTSEYISVLDTSAKYFQQNGRDDLTKKLQDQADLYMNELNNIHKADGSMALRLSKTVNPNGTTTVSPQANDSLPQAVPNQFKYKAIYSGFGYDFVLGESSLASLAQYRLIGDDPYILDQTSMPKFNLPIQELQKDDLVYGHPEMGYGQYTKESELISDLYMEHLLANGFISPMTAEDDQQLKDLIAKHPGISSRWRDQFPARKTLSLMKRPALNKIFSWSLHRAWRRCNSCCRFIKPKM